MYLLPYALWHVDCIILHCSKCFENVKHRSDEDKVKYQLGDYWLIQNQILQNNTIRIVCQTVKRITNEILGVEGLVFIRLLVLCFYSFFSPHFRFCWLDKICGTYACNLFVWVFLQYSVFLFILIGWTKMKPWQDDIICVGNCFPRFIFEALCELRHCWIILKSEA